MAEEKTQPVADVEEEKKKLDFSTLEARLEELDAEAFTHAERECRMTADVTPDLVYSSHFCGRLAAKAMNVSYNEIKALKIPEFVEVTQRVRRFLLQSLGQELLAAGN